MTDTISLRRLGDPDVNIRGKLIASVQSEKMAVGEGEQWGKISLMRLTTGWAVIGQRAVAGPRGAAFVGDYVFIEDISLPPAETASPYLVVRTQGTADEAQEHLVGSTMTWLRWSLLAKDLAAKLGWNISVERE